jgi:abhydrolase domain-containing protein 6
MTELLTGALAALLLLSLLAFLAVRLFPDQLARLALSAGRRSARLQARSVVIDGETWHFLEGGPADGETVLLVHGFGSDKDSWVLYARELTRNYRVIAPDLPGFGDSTRQPEQDYTVRPQARRLHGFVTGLGLERFHLGGISMGGHISGLYALAYPERLRTLTLIDNAGVDVPVKSDIVLEVDEGRNPLTFNTMEEFDQMLDLVTYKPIRMPGFVKRYALKQAQQNSAFFDRIFWSIVEDSPDSFMNDRLGSLQTPTLILWGRHDRLIDVSCAEVMAAAIPDNTVVVLEECGHAPIIELPRVAAGHHRKFISSAVS